MEIILENQLPKRRQSGIIYSIAIDSNANK